MTLIKAEKLYSAPIRLALRRWKRIMRHIVINSIIFIYILQIAPIHSQNNAPIYPENFSYCKKEARHPGRTYFHYFHQVMIISLKAPLILPFIFLYCFLNFVVRRKIVLHIMNERNGWV
jgi:hypothetical protein